MYLRRHLEDLGYRYHLEYLSYPEWIADLAYLGYPEYQCRLEHLVLLELAALRVPRVPGPPPSKVMLILTLCNGKMGSHV